MGNEVLRLAGRARVATPPAKPPLRFLITIRPGGNTSVPQFAPDFPRDTVLSSGSPRGGSPGGVALPAFVRGWLDVERWMFDVPRFPVSLPALFPRHAPHPSSGLRTPIPGLAMTWV